ncbi:hypothetical protein EST38_g12942 [Candolleomyces aberdarensis]|uniref:Uncharacterized protein n=1 Tax=Candolleomyces aberdarensis TaxID=2316362 RepID=A0A4Q2D3H8_9AGAR|nr:hypothetical protein EST38_g12942 [Candolleomyces aberdarensis]
MRRNYKRFIYATYLARLDVELVLGVWCGVSRLAVLDLFNAQDLLNTFNEDS